MCFNLIKALLCYPRSTTMDLLPPWTPCSPTKFANLFPPRPRFPTPQTPSFEQILNCSVFTMNFWVSQWGYSGLLCFLTIHHVTINLIVSNFDPDSDLRFVPRFRPSACQNRLCVWPQFATSQCAFSCCRALCSIVSFAIYCHFKTLVWGWRIGVEKCVIDINS